MRRRLFLCALALLTIAVLAAPQTVSADVNDFIIHDFQAKYELFNDTHGGRMRTTETIRLTFSDQNHGILRAIPTEYKDQSLRLNVLSIKRDGQKEPHTTYGQAGNEVLKIGDANRTITGAHTYEIQYEMRNVIGFYEDKTEWYWDINGHQWQQPFEHVSGEVVFPADWSDDGLPEASCYTGPVDSTGRDCTLEKTERGYSFAASRPLPSYAGLTLAVAAPRGLFTPRDRGDWLRDNAWQFVGLAAGIAVAVWSFKQWWRYGKDYKGRGVIIPEYAPPEHLSPAEVGLLMDYRLDGRDLTATVIDLAVRGFIRIHDEEKKRLGLFPYHQFSLELVKDDFAKLKKHETELLEAMFSPAVAGTMQSLATIDRTKMYKAVTQIRKDLKQALTKEHGLIEEKPHLVWVKLGVALVIVVALLIFGKPGWGGILGLALAAGSGALLAVLLKRRSHAGVEMYEKIQGLKLYMNVAEKDRLSKQQSVERPYEPPARTVHLFEKLLPFAVALGVEQSWAKQFEGIYHQPPGWYDGNFSTFHMAYFASSLSSGVSAMNSSFTQSTSSSSSGSGGGGSSGGGGGGGGGGGW